NKYKDKKLKIKITQYKINKNKTISAKERLIISMINYFKIVETDFYESNAWKKLKNILLIYYRWEEDVTDRLDYVIDYVYLYTPTKEDLKIIENDLEIIKN